MPYTVPCPWAQEGLAVHLELTILVMEVKCRQVRRKIQDGKFTPAIWDSASDLRSKEVVLHLR